MQILQPAHSLLRAELERFTDRLTSRDGGGAVDLVLQGVTTDLVGVSDVLTPLGGIYDQGDLIILDHVDDMRTAFSHLVHSTNWQTSSLDHLGGAGSGNHFKAQRD